MPIILVFYKIELQRVKGAENITLPFWYNSRGAVVKQLVTLKLIFVFYFIFQLVLVFAVSHFVNRIQTDSNGILAASPCSAD